MDLGDVGCVIGNLKGAQFSDPEVNVIIKAVFVTRSYEVSLTAVAGE